MNTNINDIKDIYATLIDKLLQRMPEPGRYSTLIPGLEFNRRDVANRPEICWVKPILSLTIQGAKRTVMGNEEYRVEAGNCLLGGVDLPNLSYLTKASPENPYLSMTLELDSQLITQLASQIPLVKGSTKGSIVTPITPKILNAFVRLFDLLDMPEKSPLVAPIIIQEIHIMLLLGPLGGLLKTLNTQGSQNNLIYQGINWLRENFIQSLDVDGLAKMVNMAPSTFRKHFKIITSMNPTQYHKHLRLYEAQRRILENNETVVSASYAVGYESTAHFNREYKQIFGDTPIRSVARMQTIT